MTLRCGNSEITPRANKSVAFQTEKEGSALRARLAGFKQGKGRTADSTQLSIFDDSISREIPFSHPVAFAGSRGIRVLPRASEISDR